MRGGAAVSKRAGFALFMIGLIGLLSFGAFMLHSAQVAEQEEKSDFLAVLKEN